MNNYNIYINQKHFEVIDTNGVPLVKTYFYPQIILTQNYIQFISNEVSIFKGRIEDVLTVNDVPFSGFQQLKDIIDTIQKSVFSNTVNAYNIPLNTLVGLCSKQNELIEKLINITKKNKK